MLLIRTKVLGKEKSIKYKPRRDTEAIKSVRDSLKSLNNEVRKLEEVEVVLRLGSCQEYKTRPMRVWESSLASA